MVNGRLYDAATLNEIGNYDRPRSKFYWELGRNYPEFPLGDANMLEDSNLSGCVCGQH